MVETKEEADSSDPHGGGDKKASHGGKNFKKKNNQKSNYAVDRKTEGVPELLKGVCFSISRDGPDVYLKGIKRLGVYVCSTYKNGSDVQMCLEEEELVLPEEPILPENPTPHQKKMWDLRATAAIKNEELLKQNMKSLYTIVMSLCDPIMEDKVSCHKDFANIKRTRDVIKLLQVIKQMMYSNGSEEHIVHNQVVATINLLRMRQERGQTPQSFREQFMAMKQVCDQLGLNVGSSEQGALAVLKKEGVTNPSTEQLKDATKKVSEEFHAILFLYLADRQRYGKILEDMENAVLQKKDTFPKTVSEACRLLIGWRNNYGGRSVRNEANDGVAFTTVSAINDDGEEQPKKGKKKEITCFRCKKVGHYASECEEELPAKTDKKGTNMLILDEDSSVDYASQEEEDVEDSGHFNQGDIANRPVTAGVQENQEHDEETESDESDEVEEDAANEFFEDDDYEGVVFVQQDILCNVQHNAGIPNSWMLLDSQSTVDVFCNPKMLTNIRDAKRQLILHCNAGTASVTKKGDLKGYGTVWYHPEGIANILSLNNVKKKYKVTFDSELGDGFVVHKGNGSQRIFKPSKKGLYYSDVASDVGTSLVTTVDSLKNKYSVRQYSSAKKARHLQDTIGRPSTDDLIKYVEGHMIPNCNVTREDIIRSEEIFGPNLGSLKGKTTRRPTEHVRTTWTSVPEDILNNHGNVTITIDIMAINKIPFIVTKSRDIHFGTAELIRNKTKNTIMTSIAQVVRQYQSRGFKVRNILADGAFECIRNRLSEIGIGLNITSRNEHVPEIERYIRLIKERTRAIANSLPFKKYPPRLIAEMVYNVVFWLNSFPHRDGVHATISPRTLLTGLAIDYNKHCKVAFGTYVQVHEEGDNSLNPRTSGAITLRPTGNDQGGYYFLSLHSGKRINRYAWTELPMPNEVIEQIHRLARTAEKYEGIVFTDMQGNILEDQLNENDNTEGEHETQEHEEEEISDDNTFTYEQGPGSVVGPDYEESSNASDEVGHTDSETDILDNNIIPTEAEEEEESNDRITIEDINITTEMNTSQLAIQEESEEHGQDATENVPTHGYNLRKRPTKCREMISMTQTGLLTGVGGESATIHPKVHAHIILTQVNVKQGLIKYGNKGSEAVLKELQQLHNTKALLPVKKDDLSYDEKRKALKYLMFLKEKRDGTIKARGCADGRPQRLYTTKEEASSPTVSLEALMLSCAIDAKETRYVAITDIPGAFLHADMEGIVHMMLEGEIAELIVKLDSSYAEYVWYDRRGKPMIYVQLKKALYGTLQAALLFWRLLSNTLQEWGFHINEYDRCVANKTINGRQCTITWHVDDLKISHAEKAVVDNILKKLNEKFGKNSPITTTRGKVLEYLGMTIDYRKKGKVTFSMEEYIKKLLEEAPYDMNGTAKTPAANHLFNVNDGAKKLAYDKAELFHHMVAKLLYLCRRTRQDIQTAVAFLCTRVKCPDEDDYKKLTRVIQYIRDTQTITLTIEANDNPRWWVDSSYAVHPDMKSHTGVLMSIGKGCTYTASNKQKLNTKSSTEAELVAVDDAMGQVLWTRHFLAAQGIPVPATTIYQDNKSTILLSENGRLSSSKRTRHLNVRYFFVTDKIQKGEVKVAYCPTENMLADFFTKPLQGSAFRKMRDIILNLPSNQIDGAHRSVLSRMEK